MVILLALLLSLGALALVSAQSGAQQTHSGRDYNGDDAVGFEDVLSLLLRGRADPAAPELDYNADGVYSTQDALDFLLDLMWGRLAPYAVVVTPRETDELLLNPGMGFVSVESFNNWVRQFRHPLCSIAQQFECLGQDRVAVGRVDQASTVGLIIGRPAVVQEGHHVGTHHAATVEPRAAQVGADDRAVAAVALDERRPRRAPTESLDAGRAGAREQVQERPAEQPFCLE